MSAAVVSDFSITNIISGIALTVIVVIFRCPMLKFCKKSNGYPPVLMPENFLNACGLEFPLVLGVSDFGRNSYTLLICKRCLGLYWGLGVSDLLTALQGHGNSMGRKCTAFKVSSSASVGPEWSEMCKTIP